MAAFQVMSTNEDCGAMQIILRSTFIRSSFLIRSVLSIIGIAVTATIFKIRGDYMCFHPNARILLHAFVVWNFILSISLLVANITDTIRYIHCFGLLEYFSFFKNFHEFVKMRVFFKIFTEKWDQISMKILII